MTSAEFTDHLLALLRALPYIDDISLSPSRHQIKGKAQVTEEYTLFFSYHDMSYKLTFAIIASQGRIWGLDKHPPLGWHRHPLFHPEEHQPIAPRSIEEIVEEIDQIFAQLLAQDAERSTVQDEGVPSAYPKPNTE